MAPFTLRTTATRLDCAAADSVKMPRAESSENNKTRIGGSHRQRFKLSATTCGTLMISNICQKSQRERKASQACATRIRTQSELSLVRSAQLARATPQVTDGLLSTVSDVAAIPSSDSVGRRKADPGTAVTTGKNPKKADANTLNKASDVVKFATRSRMRCRATFRLFAEWFAWVSRSRFRCVGKGEAPR